MDKANGKGSLLDLKIMAIQLSLYFVYHIYDLCH